MHPSSCPHSPTHTLRRLSKHNEREPLTHPLTSSPTHCALLWLLCCSVAFLENSDHADLTKQTLKKQYQLVKARTSNNFTYTQVGRRAARLLLSQHAEHGGCGSGCSVAAAAMRGPSAAPPPHT